jgi:peptidoglycan/LPS O-acetylase OafA/YrhL
MIEFLIGVWIYHVWNAGWIGRVGPGVLAGSFLVLGVLIAYLDGLNIPESIRWLALGPVATAIVVVAIAGEGAFKVPAGLIAIGNASYSLYLLHPYIVLPAQMAVRAVTHHTFVILLAAPFMIGAAILLALMTYRWIERPSNIWLTSRLLGSNRHRVSAARPGASSAEP